MLIRMIKRPYIVTSTNGMMKAKLSFIARIAPFRKRKCLVAVMTQTGDKASLGKPKELTPKGFARVIGEMPKLWTMF